MFRSPPARREARASVLLFLLALACGGDDQPIDEPPTPEELAAREAAGALVTTVCSVAPDDAVDERPPAEWRTFRAAYPYHIQAVALGPATANGSRLLVISEPAPWVCLSGLRALAPELRDLRVQQWRVGHDGWVRDVTVRLPRLDSLELGLLLQDVHRHLFGTTYKAQTLSLRPGDGPARVPLDLSVSAAELRRWLVVDREHFAPYGTGTGQTAQMLLARRAYGVHYSTVPGLVLWILPRHRNIAVHHIESRQWALDADIVLGAVADTHAVAIVARERRVDPEFLPPLRAETILQLAAATNEHLAQSYERTFVLAGRVPDGMDWAPIYLSPELIDTEYGSLLNITDQMLKSWSQHGDVRYVNFPYPMPSGFPFATPLSEHLAAARVTFNWNTKGAGYVATDDTIAFYALNRTGALPVSYFAGNDQEANDATLAAERTAYDYFALLDDPNLARVVQYAALYQIFRAFDVQGSAPAPAPVANQRAALKSHVRAALGHMLEADSSTFYHYFTPAAVERVVSAHSTLRMVHAIDGDAALDRIAERLVRDRGDEAAMRRDWDLEERVAPNGRLVDGASAADAQAWHELDATHRMDRVLRAFTSLEEDTDALRAFEAAAAEPSRAWIHTATIVRSRNVGDERLVGGHNLDAAVTRFRAAPELPPGQVRVIEENGQRVILANDGDIGRMAGHIRTIAGTDDAAALEANLNALLPRVRAAAVRPRALAIPVPARQGQRGLPFGRSAFDVGHATVSRELTAAERAAHEFLETQQRAFTGVTRLPDLSYEIVLGGTGEVVRAPNVVSALDVIAHQPRMHAPPTGAARHQYQLYGFSDLDAAAFSRDIEIALRRSGRAGASDEVAGVVMREGVDARGMLDVATRRLDLANAEVLAVQETRVLIHGRSHRALQVDVQVTAAATRQSFLMRIWIVFRDGVTRPAMEAVQAQVAVLLRALGRDVPTDFVAAAIRTELKRSFGSIEHVRTEFDDVVLVDATPTLRQDSDGSERGHAAD